MSAANLLKELSLTLYKIFINSPIAVQLQLTNVPSKLRARAAAQASRSGRAIDFSNHAHFSDRTNDFLLGVKNLSIKGDVG